jgi:hypothetical protein
MKKIKKYEKQTIIKRNINFGSINIKFLIFTIIIISIGFFIMSRGDRTISPIVLTISYIILVPLSLLIKSKNE